MVPLAADALAPETKRARIAATPAARNPFASFAPAGGAREANAETKLYEVPRELIEIARANSAEADAIGVKTPLAPRPDAELEATLREYAARVSSVPAGVSPALVELAQGASAGAVEAVERAEAAPLPLSVRRNGPRGASPRLAAPLPRAATASRRSRAWMVYAALSLAGLASCAHVLLGS